MPVVYYDNSALASGGYSRHPAWALDKTHACYKITRSYVAKKSMFHWTREEALKMYEWLIENYNANSIVDEFDEPVQRYEFEEILKKSYYEETKGKPSAETIQEIYDAYQVQKRLQEAADKELLA